MKISKKEYRQLTWQLALAHDGLAVITHALGLVPVAGINATVSAIADAIERLRTRNVHARNERDAAVEAAEAAGVVYCPPGEVVHREGGGGNVAQLIDGLRTERDALLSHLHDLAQALDTNSSFARQLAAVALLKERVSTYAAERIEIARHLDALDKALGTPPTPSGLRFLADPAHQVEGLTAIANLRTKCDDLKAERDEARAAIRTATEALGHPAGVSLDEAVSATRATIATLIKERDEARAALQAARDARKHLTWSERDALINECDTARRVYAEDLKNIDFALTASRDGRIGLDACANLGGVAGTVVVRLRQLHAARAAYAQERDDALKDRDEWKRGCEVEAARKNECQAEIAATRDVLEHGPEATPALAARVIARWRAERDQAITERDAAHATMRDARKHLRWSDGGDLVDAAASVHEALIAAREADAAAQLELATALGLLRATAKDLGAGDEAATVANAVVQVGERATHWMMTARSAQHDLHARTERAKALTLRAVADNCNALRTAFDDWQAQARAIIDDTYHARIPLSCDRCAAPATQHLCATHHQHASTP